MTKSEFLTATTCGAIQQWRTTTGQLFVVDELNRQIERSLFVGLQKVVLFFHGVFWILSSLFKAASFQKSSYQSSLVWTVHDQSYWQGLRRFVGLCAEYKLLIAVVVFCILQWSFQRQRVHHNTEWIANNSDDPAVGHSKRFFDHKKAKQVDVSSRMKKAHCNLPDEYNNDG